MFVLLLCSLYLQPGVTEFHFQDASCSSWVSCCFIFSPWPFVSCFSFPSFLDPRTSTPCPGPHLSLPLLPLIVVKWQFGWSSSSLRAASSLLTEGNRGRGTRLYNPKGTLSTKAAESSGLRERCFFQVLNFDFCSEGWCSFFFCHCLQSTLTVFSLALELS